MVSQDIRRENFIGRKRELELFENWLRNPKGPWILYFHDASTKPDKRGGVGKTWLLRRCTELTQERYPDRVIVSIDLFNVIDRNGITIVERVIKQLKDAHPAWSPTDSEAILAEYHANNHHDADHTSLQRKLANAVAKDLSSLDNQLRFSNRHLLIFYDTFEVIEQDPVIAVLNPTQKFPDRYQFNHIGVVMAGRNPLPWKDRNSNWHGREQEVHEVALETFSQKEMIDYLNAFSNVQTSNNQKMQALHERTEGRPILVGLAADIIRTGISTLDDLLLTSHPSFEEILVSKIGGGEQPINRAVLFMAHAYHRFNPAILHWVRQESDSFPNMPQAEYANMLNDLPTLSFVRRASTSNDFILHDEMRHLVKRYCWQQLDPNTSFRAEISRCMIRYYEGGLVNAQNELMKQSYTVEMLYHKLFVNLNDGLAFFEQVFEKALTLWACSYARSLLLETQNLLETQKLLLSQEQQYRLVVLEAELLQREENPRRALTSYQYLAAEADRDWFTQNCSTIYYGLADCFLSLGNFPAAIENTQKSLQIKKEADNKEHQAELLGTLGYIFQRQGKFDDAITFYRQSMAIYKQIANRREYADKLNSMGYIYHLQGKIDKALRYCQRALQIREDLLKEGKVGQIQKGLSLSAIGNIYLDSDVAQAKDYFQQALTIFQRAKYKKGIARIYNRLGWIEEKKDDLNDAMECFREAYKAAISVDAQEEQINSLNHQGRVLIHQNNFTEAIKCFEQALTLSTKLQDRYREVESLVGLAETFEYSGRQTEAQQHLERARGLALENRYYLLLGGAETFQGKKCFQQLVYDAAFQHFVQSCHYLALFNLINYEEAVALLIKYLEQTPRDLWPNIVNTVRTYWSDNDMNAHYPYLIQRLEELEDLEF